MTKLSISLAAAVLSVTFAPSAGAYSLEPEDQSITLASLQTPVAPLIATEGACAVVVPTVLASILNLPQDWQGNDAGPAQTALACADE